MFSVQSFCSLSKRQKGCPISHCSRNARCCQSKGSSTRVILIALLTVSILDTCEENSRGSARFLVTFLIMTI